MKQYAFILGRVYTLSLAELFFYFQRKQIEVNVVDLSFEVLIIQTEKFLDIEQIQKDLGGTVKILKVIDEFKKREQDSVNFVLRHYFKPGRLKKDYLTKSKGKIQFGVSVYLLDSEVQAFGEPKRLGMMIKRGLQDAGASIRLVLPKFNSLTLASVVVNKNNLLQKGAEICVLVGQTKLYVAKTISIQDFEDYGRRDYQRPIRDEKQGMIPPKVAQMMINFASQKRGATILDPMCGIGTVVQESVLLGYRALGTDINHLAISGSDKNLEWFRNRYKVPKGKYHLETSDVKEVSKIVENLKNIKAFDQINAVVTEGYLGPMYSDFPTQEEITQNFAELKTLYTKAFQDFLKFLPEGASIVMCLPAYKKRDNYTYFPHIDELTKIGYSIKDLISRDLALNIPFLKLTDRGTAVYDRKDQIVAREIIIFQKN
ncbi:MAG: hypothetical protein R3B41_04135 [Candidatus Doudnabacteria bacterium]